MSAVPNEPGPGMRQGRARSRFAAQPLPYSDRTAQSMRDVIDQREYGAGVVIAELQTMEADHDTEVLPPRRGLRLLLPDHHRRLEAKSRELLTWAYADDSRELAAAWCELEAELLDHIAAEEDVILPAYAKHSPGDAQRILEDHARIRELVTPTGVEVELHFSRAARLKRLIEALDAHAEHEDAFMYPWAQVNLPQLALHGLFVRIGRWFGGI